MPNFTVDLTCRLEIEVEASNKAEAKKRALHYAGWLDPTAESIWDYNDDHDGIENATLSVDPAAAVVIAAADELCTNCWDPRCDGCSPPDTPSLDTSFHDHEMGG
jgi:hypothetical protein